jgi:AmiR/NasT family two-component response regulator
VSQPVDHISNHRVLIAEDEALIRMDLAEMLAEEVSPLPERVTERVTERRIRRAT